MRAVDDEIDSRAMVCIARCADDLECFVYLTLGVATRWIYWAL